MEMDLLQAISQVGFPIAVAAFSLIRLEAAIKSNTECTNKMLIMFESMKEFKGII
jgi:hypothetical protein